ncbi:lysophospholipid acyltransferase family protein [Auraticoccus monumenti]|uniref:1-acyl-sn-glycerol-3-phosphate acyltransferase n=1 Tax=Auraticoccus monumenti TaxID=675864 RepID=A0A1G7DS14_9ACTN|nr:lysophospholipid acyltransferase family protein [Auraticoccus monumenti]SDE54324.1 1-acyl-sn-glycerol-3-phosphate acyltransferase [Auraticoccus monumenti]
MNAYSIFRGLLFRPLIRLLWRPWMEGVENVPTSGPVILVSNHVSWGDTLFTPAMLPRQMTFPAKGELFETEGKGPLAKLVAWFLRTVGMHPMDRSGGRGSVDSLALVNDSLDREQLVLGIYPEGTRSPDGRLYKGKTGVARLVLAGHAAVLPVGVVSSEIHRGPLGIPMMHRPGLRIGRPLDFEEYRGQPPNREVLRWVTDEIMAAIQELTGQQYVDVYAASVKTQALEPGALDDRVLARPGLGTTKPPVPVLAAPEPVPAGPVDGVGSSGA